MYKVLFTVSLFVVAGVVTAQIPNFNEFFRQKKTQKRYLRKQIALLETYSRFVKKGYEISQKGLNLIGEIKDGNFKQHQDYFASLTVVKPALKNWDGVSVTTDYLDRIDRNLSNIISGPYKEEFSPEEWEDITTICDQFKSETNVTRESLMEVITDGELQMKDGERLTRIEYLYKTTQSIYKASREFSNVIESLWIARVKAESEIQLMRDLNAHGI